MTAERRTLASATSCTALLPRRVEILQHDSSNPNVYLRKDLRPLGRFALDLSALPWGHRLRLLRQHVLPVTRFIGRRYNVARDALPPACYVRRLLKGAAKWLLPSM
jgi:hypothetical protein